MSKHLFCPVCLIRALFNKKLVQEDTTEEYNNFMALTPPMGWSSWNTFKNTISEDLILQTAKSMVSNGLVDAGYNYLNVDDCWHSSMRDENGELVADYVTFPHGMKWLVNEVNKMGIKVGAYTSNGTLTCEDLPASLYNEQKDANTLAKWGVEYFKYDFCHNEPIPQIAPLVYSITVADFNGNKKEYSVRNARLNGLAKFKKNKHLPNKTYVNGLDKNQGSIDFDNIIVPNDGEYILCINILKKGQYKKYLVVNINNEDLYEIDFPSQKPYNYTACFQKIVKLKKGNNTVKLYNPISNKSDSEFYQYRRMGLALQNATKEYAVKNNCDEKPITYSICEWGVGKPWKWGSKSGNLWRTTHDINPWWFWICMIYERNVKLYKYASIGHWNDPDMLEVGNGKLTNAQNQSHFNLWCMMNSPLILGNDVRNISESVLNIVTNKNMIQINQDKLGKQGKRIKKGLVDTIIKPLADGSIAVCLFNKSNITASSKLDIKKIIQDEYCSQKISSQYQLKNMWTDDIKTIKCNDVIKVKLPKYSSVVYKIVK